jgi:hypothetical protein
MDMADLLRRTLSQLGGGGGGRPEYAQGGGLTEECAPDVIRIALKHLALDIA